MLFSETAELLVLAVDTGPFDTASQVPLIGSAPGSTVFSPGAMVTFLVLSGAGWGRITRFGDSITLPFGIFLCHVSVAGNLLVTFALSTGFVSF